jgi:branched-chain amino acid transport system ATP-binding protein
MSLKLNNITVKYGTAMAVTDISLTVEDGAIVSIIGANGAGKSTILKAISGLIRLNSGEIIFNGKAINGMAIDKIVRMGIAQVPEERCLFPYMSVMDNLILGAFLRKDKSGIASDFEKVFSLFPRLKERRNQKAGSLSGGEQQMLAVGRA